MPWYLDVCPYISTFFFCPFYRLKCALCNCINDSVLGQGKLICFGRFAGVDSHSTDRTPTTSNAVGSGLSSEHISPNCVSVNKKSFLIQSHNSRKDSRPGDNEFMEPTPPRDRKGSPLNGQQSPTNSPSSYDRSLLIVV